MKKIGFFGGSFNPPSNIHINIAEMILSKYNLDEVIFVPVGNYYLKDNLEDENLRYEMLKLATEGNDKLMVEKICLNSTKNLYAIDTFNLIKKKYNKDKIYFIMGSDNFRKMPQWQKYDEIINTYNFIVIERERKTLRNDKENIHCLIPSEFEEVNSTEIRRMLKDKNGNALKYLNKNVYKYILDRKIYK